MIKAIFILILLQIPTIGIASTYSFGIVPQQAAVKLARLWGPIFSHIEEQSGLRLIFSTAPNIPEFERRLSEGEYDIAYMNPYHYTVFHDSAGYHAIAKSKDKRIKGIFVVHKDSPILSLSDLNKKHIAFPSPAAFAATLITQAELGKQQIDYKAKYVSSHDSVYKNVIKGIYPAGGGIIRTLNSLDNDLRKQLKILWESEEYTPHAIAVHPRVPKKHILLIQESLINIEKNHSAKLLLNKLKIKGFETAENNNWNDVRSLNIKKLNY